MMIHAALLAAVQLHPAAAATLTEPLPPALVKLWMVGEIAAHMPVTCTQAENSEVLPAESVAVAVTTWPTGTVTPGSVMAFSPVKLATQFAAVVTIAEPR